MAGRVRDFSEAKRKELIGYSEVNGGFFSFNWLTDIQYWFKDISLKNDLSNVEQYHKDIIDKKNASSDKINDIFNKVKEVDHNYSLVFNQNKELLQAYNSLVKGFLESMGNIPDFDVNSFIDSIGSCYYKMTLFQWEEIMNKSWDKITYAEYEKLAWMMLTTKDLVILETMLQKCYDLQLEVAMMFIAFKGAPTYLFNKNPKMYCLNNCMQAMTNSLLLGADSADPLMKARLMNEETLATAIHNAQLMQAIFLYDLPRNEFISSLDHTPSLKFDVDKNGDYLLTIRTTVFYELDYGYKTDTSYRSDSHTLTVTKPVYGKTADEINKKQYKQLISSLVGLSTGDYVTTFASSAIDIASLFGAPLTGGASTVLGTFNALMDPIQKIEDRGNYKIITDIGNIGVVADSFNLYYVSSDIDNKPASVSISLYPTISTGDVLSTQQCVHNFIGNLYNPSSSDAYKIDSARFVLEEKGYITPKAALLHDPALLESEERRLLDTILSDPKTVSNMLDILVESRINLNDLIDNKPK